MRPAPFYRSLLALNIRSSFSEGVWLQMALMTANNAIFWITWLVFFRTFQSVNGWRLPEVTLMYATCQLSWGVKIVLFGGTRNLARTISDGEIDGYLLQPRHPLLHVAATRSIQSGWGDVASGTALALLSGLLGPAQLPLYLVAVACAATTFLAVEIILHSVAFWAGPVNTLARNLTEYLIMLSCYPQNVYTGWFRIAMHVVVPAAVIGLLPVQLIKGDWLAGAEMVALTAAFAGLALAVFRRGVRRYARG